MIKTKRLIDRWSEWHDCNPEFYALFCKFSKEAQDAGAEKISAWLVVNRIRWETRVKAKGLDHSIPNDFIALFARKYLKDHPDAGGLFELRPLTRVTTQELKDCL